MASAAVLPYFPMVLRLHLEDEGCIGFADDVVGSIPVSRPDDAEMVDGGDTTEGAIPEHRVVALTEEPEVINLVSDDEEEQRAVNRSIAHKTEDNSARLVDQFQADIQQLLHLNLITHEEEEPSNSPRSVVESECLLSEELPPVSSAARPSSSDDLLDDVLGESRRRRTRSTAAADRASQGTSLPGTWTDTHIQLMLTASPALVMKDPTLPPYPPDHTRDPSGYYEATELMGKYLIQRAFPLIGVGESTLVFLIGAASVAKVARYDQSVNKKLYDSHCDQRNLDVFHYRDHPLAFAATKYQWITPQHHPYWQFSQPVYVQELLTPKPPGWSLPANFSSKPKKYPNWREIQLMIYRNPNTSFNQWGVRASGEVVCYDYK